MWGHDQVEANGLGDERIHLRQNKEGGLLHTLQGSCEEDSRGGTVGGVIFKEGKVGRIWCMELSLVW